MTAPARTSLYDLHAGLGASLTDFAGWAMPVRYGSDIAEHRAVRAAAGLFDLGHMGEIEVSGPDAAGLLDHALVGHLSALDVGRARYTMLCDETGGVLDDLVVYRLTAERYLVVANAANTDVVLAALRARSTGFAAECTDRTDRYGLLAIQGPRAAAIVAKLCDSAVDDLRYYAIDAARVADTPVLIARTGYTGEDGFELFCAPADAVGLWHALTDAGASDGLVPAGLAARDTLRLEAGMPLYGHELTADRTPYEAGLGRVVRLDKPGDFVGRAALAARHQDGPAAVLVGLAGRGRRSARAGYAVLDSDGATVGTVTSGAPSPTLGRPIAMAHVAPRCADPGTPLTVDVRGAHETFDVVALPFYRRAR
jgi:aminomethyltransferase